ncbi:MAG: molybdopterin-dependent oxidoreductase [Flavobacteriales bacterium]|nr:molybdopterin-dependent oxidoreductase [Flavobacteriales bacterium]
MFLTNHGRHPSRMTIQLGAKKRRHPESARCQHHHRRRCVRQFCSDQLLQRGATTGPVQALDNFGSPRIVCTPTSRKAVPCAATAQRIRRFVVESLIDDIAHRIGMDPVEMRMKTPSSRTPLPSVSTASLKRQPRPSRAWRSGRMEARGKLPPRPWAGRGLRLFISGSALPIIRNELPQSTVHLKLDFDGRVRRPPAPTISVRAATTMLAASGGRSAGPHMEHLFVSAPTRSSRQWTWAAIRDA